MAMLVNHSCSEYTERFWFSSTDLAISLTIHKSFFVEFDCSLIDPLTCVVFSDLSTDLGCKLSLHGDGVRLLQLHSLQHLGLHIPSLWTSNTKNVIIEIAMSISLQQSQIIIEILNTKEHHLIYFLAQNIWANIWKRLIKLDISTYTLQRKWCFISFVNLVLDFCQQDQITAIIWECWKFIYWVDPKGKVNLERS